MPGPSYHGRTHGVDGTDPIQFPVVGATAAVSYAEIIAAIASNYGYYKLPETASADWADSSGSARDLTYVSRGGTTRGVAGFVDEGDGTLAVDVGSGDSPGAAHAPAHVGFRADTFFQFAGLQPFTVMAFVNRGFAIDPGSIYYFGIVGTSDETQEGWGLFVRWTDLKVMFGRYENAGGLAVGDFAVATNILPAAPTLVMAVFDGTNYKIFMDGALDSTTTPGTPYTLTGSASDDLQLGSVGLHIGFGGTHNPWVGQIDSVLIADVDLSDYANTLFDAVSASVVGPISGIDATGIPAGQVITATGAPTAVWAYPTIEVEY